MLNDPTLTASADPVPTGRTTPASAPAEVLGGQLMGGGGEYQPTFLERVLRQDTDWKSITDQTNAEIRREAQARGHKDFPQFTVEQIRTRDKNMKGNFLDAAMSMNPYSETSPTPTMPKGSNRDPSIQRLYESEKIKRVGQQETQQWLERFDNEPLAQFQSYQNSDVASRIAQEAGPEVAQQVGLVVREHGGDPADLYQRLQLLMQGGNDPEEAFADLTNYAASKRQKRKMNYLISRGLAKYDPLTQM